MEFNQNIFTLRAQINYIRDCLQQRKGSVEKVKNVFGSRHELEAVKDGISKKIVDLARQAPLEFANDIQDLRNQWGEVQASLQDEKEISESLQEATKDLKEKMRLIYQKRFEDRESQYAFVRDFKQEMRVNNAVQPQFQKISQTVLDSVRDKYPDLIREIFKLALLIDAGGFGEKTKDAYEYADDYRQNPDAHIQQKLSELIDPLNLDADERKAVVELFLTYLHELSAATHQKVQLLLGQDYDQEAIAVASALKSPLEKSLGLAVCVEKLAGNGEIDRALALVDEISHKPEVIRSYGCLLNRLLEEGQLDRALLIVEELDNGTRNLMLKEMAIKLVHLRRLSDALQVADRVEDLEARSYLQSTLVITLMQLGLHKEAEKLARSIKDDGAREDAYGYIVKEQLQRRKPDEALKFAASIRNPSIKKNIAKILESAMKAQHQDDKVQKVRKQFRLSRQFPNVA